MGGEKGGEEGCQGAGDGKDTRVSSFCCFTDTIALDTPATWRLIVRFPQEETEAKKGESLTPAPTARTSRD